MVGGAENDVGGVGGDGGGKAGDGIGGFQEGFITGFSQKARQPAESRRGSCPLGRGAVENDQNSVE